MRSRAGNWRSEFVASGEEAADLLAAEEFDVVLSGLELDGRSGLDLLVSLRLDPRTASLPFILLTRDEERAQRRAALELGATDFLNKPIDGLELLVRLDNVLRVKSYQDVLKTANADLERKVAERTAALEVSRREAVYYLARAAETRDTDTGNHILRVANFSAALAEALGMDSTFVERLGLSASLHDIGKIGIPDSILRKPGALTVEERATMQEHCHIGARILGDVPALARSAGSEDEAALLNQARAVALSHHERWDGSGYPNRVSGDAIPLEARIVAIVDVYDALRTERTYKRAMDVADAMEIMAASSGTHFDPGVYGMFERILPRIEEIRDAYRDTPAPVA